MEFKGPRLRRLESTAEALVVVTFDQPMKFDKDWVELMNKEKDTRRAGLSVDYLNGFEGTADYNKNRMTDWKVE